MKFGGLIAAILFAAVAAIVVLRMSPGTQTSTAPMATAAAPQLKTVNIYVASQSITIGSTITQDMLAIQPWPEHLVLDGFVRAEGGPNLAGMVARSAFQAQEPFLMNKLANPNDPNFLAGALPKGMRIITLQTNEIEGVGGFVFPGDRVDVLLTHQITRWTNGTGSVAAAPVQEVEPITETVLTNTLVVAVDQRASSGNTTDRNGNLTVPRSVSLMVSPADAQRLRLGSQKGTLTLVLRSLQDKETSDPLLTTRVSDVSAVADAGGLSADSVMVVRGIDARESVVTTTSTNATAATAENNTPAQVVRATTATTQAATAPVAAPAAAVTPEISPTSAPQFPPPPSPMR